ncbi:MAG TPA: prenyltransferase [Anaerolineales bacterium]|nr:prenyltransferase [Anaerolineales bacterium]
MKTWKYLLGPMRPPFLILAPACVLVGIGSAYLEAGTINWFYVVLALIAGISAHISVNAFNEYFDSKTGVDDRTQRTPFSGGSGTLQAHPELANNTLIMSWVTLAIPGLIGLYFMYVWGWTALPIGLVGLVLLYGYTRWMVYQPAMCLIAPGLGFGPLMVLSTHFALTGSFSWLALIASLVPFFLVSNLLLLNQFPDVEADRSAGRRHFPILLGRTTSAYIYIAFLIAAYMVVVVGVFFKLLPPFSLLALLTIVFAVQIIRSVLKNSENVPALLPAMGQNVIVNLLTPVLLAIGLFIG